MERSGEEVGGREWAGKKGGEEVERLRAEVERWKLSLGWGGFG